MAYSQMTLGNLASLGKFWMHQGNKYDFMADLTVIDYTSTFEISIL